MARILYGGGVADVRGKWNGQVHSRNKGGAFMRVKVTPINPNTSFQSTQRTILATLSKYWPTTLSDLQRSAWQSFGQAVGTTSIFGNKLILSGIAIFQRINILALTSGGTIIADPPINLEIAGPTAVTLTANHTGPVLTVGFTGATYSGTQGLYVFATPAISAGISNIGSKLRFIGFYAAPTTPLDISTEWIARFGTFPTVAGQRIAVSVHAFDQATGALTPATVASTIVI